MGRRGGGGGGGGGGAETVEAQTAKSGKCAVLT